MFEGCTLLSLLCRLPLQTTPARPQPPTNRPPKPARYAGGEEVWQVGQKVGGHERAVLGGGWRGGGGSFAAPLRARLLGFVCRSLGLFLCVSLGACSCVSWAVFVLVCRPFRPGPQGTGPRSPQSKRPPPLPRAQSSPAQPPARRPQAAPSAPPLRRARGRPRRGAPPPPRRRAPRRSAAPRTCRSAPRHLAGALS